MRHLLLTAAALSAVSPGSAQAPDNDAKLRAWVQPVSGANLKRTIEPSFTIDSVTDAEVEAQARTLRAAIQDGATVGKIKR